MAYLDCRTFFTARSNKTVLVALLLTGLASVLILTELLTGLSRLDIWEDWGFGHAVIDVSALPEDYRVSYLPVDSQTLVSVISADTPLMPVQDLPPHCLDDHLSRGGLCYHPHIQDIHVLWTWVNGSDFLLQNTKQVARQRYSKTDPYRPQSSNNEARQYRDHDELRHSMRSVLDNFRPHTRHFHIVTSDFADPAANLFPPWAPPPRLGLFPQWLDPNRRGIWTDDGVQLVVTHHAQIFDPYNNTNFNSYAIETQLAHLQDVSANFIYMNDDFFMAAPLTPMSFYTSVYGIVLRYETYLKIPPERPDESVTGEWRSMGESNYLLSRRFGFRARPYVAHEAKSASIPILREVSAMWPKKIAETASHVFRETVAGDGDFNTLFVMTHFLVERWREALLWSWTVARIGQLDNRWGDAEIAQAWHELGGAPGETELKVQASRRRTLETDRIVSNLWSSGHRGVRRTSYVFSSLDGYPYSDIGTQDEWPTFADVPQDKLPSCTVKLTECFLDSHHLASDVFTHIAFREPHCGDCIITALVKASGELGLHAFLPAPDHILPSMVRKIRTPVDVPHLPLVDDWREGNFSLDEVMAVTRETSTRNWTLQLLQRYRFVIGETPFRFVSIHDENDARAVTSSIDEDDNLVLLCLNDDVSSGMEKTDDILRRWQETRWGRPAAWER